MAGVLLSPGYGQVATTPPPVPAAESTESLVECTVVRAYPDVKGKPAPKIHDHSYEIDETINLDVRGLGVWFAHQVQAGTASRTVQQMLGNGKVDDSDYARWITAVRTSAKTLCLYINGKPFNDLLPLTVNPQWSQSDQFDSTKCPLMTLRFVLHRTPETGAGGITNAAAPAPYRPWNLMTSSLYGQMKFSLWPFRQSVPGSDLTVGVPDSGGIGLYYLSSALNPDSDEDPAAYHVTLIPYSTAWMITSIVVTLLLGVACVFLGLTTDLLRDTTVPRNPTGKYPFSLGLCQMAFWTVVITGSYLFIWCSTSNYNTFNATALILLGISAATGLGASLLNNSNLQARAASTLSPQGLAVSDEKTLITMRNQAVAALQTLSAGDPGIVAAADQVRELNYRLRYVQKPWFRFLF